MEAQVDIDSLRSQKDEGQGRIVAACADLSHSRSAMAIAQSVTSTVKAESGSKSGYHPLTLSQPKEQIRRDLVATVSSRSALAKRCLLLRHFDIALKEIQPSTSEGPTLSELRRVCVWMLRRHTIR